MSWKGYEPDDTTYELDFDAVDEQAVAGLFEAVAKQVQTRRDVRSNLRRSREEWSCGNEPRWTS